MGIILLNPCEEKRIKFIDDTFLVFKTDIKSETYDTLLFVKPTYNIITIPSYITTIGNSAFHRCSRLTGIKIQSSVILIRVYF